MPRKVLAWAEIISFLTALYVGVPLAGTTLDRILGWPPWPGFLRWAGLAPLGLGLFGILWSFAVFASEGGGTPNPVLPPRRLVTTGPFAWTRNPIILSHGLVLLGLAAVLGSSGSFLLVLALGIPVQGIVRIEERGLEARSGEAYRTYRSHVPRWIPRRARHRR